MAETKKATTSKTAETASKEEKEKKEGVAQAATTPPSFLIGGPTQDDLNPAYATKSE